MLFLNWTRAAILYEDEYGLIRLQELVRFISLRYQAELFRTTLSIISIASQPLHCMGILPDLRPPRTSRSTSDKQILTIIEQSSGLEYNSHQNHNMFSRYISTIYYFREIKKKGIFNIIVDTHPDNINIFFRVILQLQMNNHQ